MPHTSGKEGQQWQEHTTCGDHDRFKDESPDRQSFCVSLRNSCDTDGSAELLCSDIPSRRHCDQAGGRRGLAHSPPYLCLSAGHERPDGRDFAALMRHSTTALVRRYAHLSPSYLHAAVETVAAYGKPTIKTSRFQLEP